MKKTFTIAIAAIAVALVAAPAAFAQNFTVDYRANLLAADTGNYLNWSVGSETVKDKMDAASGASVGKSTYKLDAFRYDSATTKKAAAPGGFRSLLLFAMAKPDAMKADNLTAVANGKQVTVTYVHRGVAYKMETDKDGNFDVLTGAFKASVGAANAEKKFELKPEFVKKGGNSLNMADLDMTKVKYVPDAKVAEATRWYEGKLAFAYDKGILTIKGTLTEKKK